MVKQTLFVAAVAFLLDQISKWYVIWYLGLIDSKVMLVLPPYLNFYMGWNEGMNFGLLADYPGTMRWLLTVVAIGISAFLVHWCRQFNGWWAAVLIGLIIGGALGNAIDRVRHEAVADFLNMSCCGINNPYSFNLADIFVFVGAIGLLIFAERLPKKA